MIQVFKILILKSHSLTGVTFNPDAMKKNLFRFFVCCGILAATVSCVNEKSLDTNQSDLVYMTFDAGTTDVKSTFTSDYKEIHWSASDAISVFYPQEDQTYANAEFTDAELTAQSPTAHFSGKATVAEKYYAVYPYDANAKCSTDGVITTMLPTVQVATAGTFDPAASLAVATSGPAKSFSFASVCGWVGFEIPEGVTDIAQVTLAGLNHLNPIAGEVNISEDLTVITTENNDANNVVLVPAEGQDYIPAGKYYMSVIAGQKEGITVRVVTTDGKYGHKTLENATLTVTANKRIALPVYNAEDYVWEDELEVITLRFNDENGKATQPLENVNFPASGTSYLTLSGKMTGTDYYFEMAATHLAINSNKGLRIGSQYGYIVFPAIEGKRLVSVKVVTGHAEGNYSASICLLKDESEEIDSYQAVAGGEIKFTPNVAGGTTVWTLTETQVGQSYRFVRMNRVGSGANEMRIISLELSYVGEAKPEEVQPDIVIDMLKPECMTYLGTGGLSASTLEQKTFTFPQMNASDTNGIGDNILDFYSYTIGNQVYNRIGFGPYMQSASKTIKSYYYWSANTFTLCGKQTMQVPVISGYKFKGVVANTTKTRKLILSKSHASTTASNKLAQNEGTDHNMDISASTEAGKAYYFTTSLSGDVVFTKLEFVYTPAN